MSEIREHPIDNRPGIKKRKILIWAISGTAALLLIAGTAVGVQASSADTTKRCADATTAALSTNDATATSVDKAAKARAAAQGAEGYDKADGSAPLLTGLDKATQDLGRSQPSTECTSRDQAAALMSDTATVAAKVATLDAAAVKLSDHVTTFKEAETKRIAAEKKAAAKKKADDEAAAKKQADDDAAAAETADAPQAGYVSGNAASAPAGGGYVQAPVRQAPAPYVPVQPAPAPYVPVAPAPAPGGTGGGWTPPPPGAGGGHGCTQIGDHIMCS